MEEKATRKGKKRARKLSVRTNESSPFARLFLTLMVPPMLRRLPRIIKAAQGSGWQESECVFVYGSVRLCVSGRVFFTDTPQRDLQQCVPQ